MEIKWTPSHLRVVTDNPDLVDTKKPKNKQKPNHLRVVADNTHLETIRRYWKYPEIAHMIEINRQQWVIRAIYIWSSIGVVLLLWSSFFR